MWETFDWERERGRGSRSRREGAEGSLIHHSPLALKRAFQPCEGSAAWMQVSEPILTLGLIPARGNTCQNFMPAGGRQTRRQGAGGPGRGWGGLSLKHRRSPLRDLACLSLLLLLSPHPLSHRHTPLSTDLPPLSQRSSKQLPILTYEHWMPWTARIFFYWAFSIMVNNTLIQTFSPSKIYDEV